MKDMFIVVKNQTDKNQTFFFYAEKPTLDPDVHDSFSVPFVTSPKIPHPTGSCEVKVSLQLPIQWYAICGMSESPLNSAKLEISDQALATPAQDGKPGSMHYTWLKFGSEVKFQDRTSTINKDGSFQINNSQWDASRHPKAFCGLGIKLGEGHLQPVHVWRPSQNDPWVVDITPVFKLHVVAISEESTDGAKVVISSNPVAMEFDFSNTEGTIANISYRNSDPVWSEVQYTQIHRTD